MWLAWTSEKATVFPPLGVMPAMALRGPQRDPRSPDRRDDLVDEIEGLDETFDDVQAFRQYRGGNASGGDDIDLVIDIGLQRIEQVECAAHHRRGRPC